MMAALSLWVVTESGTSRKAATLICACFSTQKLCIGRLVPGAPFSICARPRRDIPPFRQLRSAICRSRQWPMECGVEGPFCRAGCGQFRWSSWTQLGSSGSDSATSVSRDVKRVKTPHDLVSAPGPRNVRTARKFGDRLNERVPIDSRLSGAEILGGPFQDIRKIELCGTAETNTPSLLGHEATIPMLGK